MHYLILYVNMRIEPFLNTIAVLLKLCYTNFERLKSTSRYLQNERMKKMKLLHLADLHIGKRVNDFQLIEDQRHILEQIIEIGFEHQIEGVMIAGDIYDKSQPSVEAIELFDDFLNKLKELDIPVFLISGNHDSPERIQYVSRLLKKNHIYIEGVFEGTMNYVELEDSYGLIRIYMLPFVKPALVRHYLEEEIESYDEAIEAVINHTPLDENIRNILIGHQFVIGQGVMPVQSESENISVGGLDQVYSEHFKMFDYVALGHLHAPQKIGYSHIRYAGSPLKYSASEVKQKKSVTIVSLYEKGQVDIQQIALKPMRDMIIMEGFLEEILGKGKDTPGWNGRFSDDYIHAVLSDEKLYDPVGKLRDIYPNLMSITFSNQQVKNLSSVNCKLEEDIQNRSMIDLFQNFFQVQNQKVLSKEQLLIVKESIERMEKEEL